MVSYIAVIVTEEEDDQLAHCSIYSHVHQMKAFDKTVIDGNEGSIRLGELSSNFT